jgi:uncharacterized protein YjbJ (UPF0337 family)
MEWQRSCGDLMQWVHNFFLKGHVMNWDDVAGKWKQFTGSVKQEWGKFTDDDIDYIGGTRDRLIGRLQEKYGFSKEEAERRADRWLTTHQAPVKK